MSLALIATTERTATLTGDHLQALADDVWRIIDELDAPLSLACLDESSQTTHPGDDLSTLHAEAEIGRVARSLEVLDGGIKTLRERYESVRGQWYDASEAIRS